MRLWSKQLIKYLPDKQLLSQWREIIAIIGNINKKGFPNHILVNKVMDYPLNHFSSYTKIIIDEMKKRNFKINETKIEYVYKFCGKPEISFDNIYSHWHNDEYTKICMFNLYEKYICGGIKEDEWNKLKNKFEYLLV